VGKRGSGEGGQGQGRMRTESVTLHLKTHLGGERGAARLKECQGNARRGRRCASDTLFKKRGEVKGGEKRENDLSGKGNFPGDSEDKRDSTDK